MSTNPASLDNLHDIIVPNPVSWWPLAPGWYVLILGLIIAATWIGIRLNRQWQQNRFRREALSELDSIKPSELPALIKRVALCIWPREQVASLSGDDWLQFLDQSSNSDAFTQGPGKKLSALSYSPDTPLGPNNLDFDELKNTIRTWICNTQLQHSFMAGRTVPDEPPNNLKSGGSPL